jgi:dihydrofolate reductase
VRKIIVHMQTTLDNRIAHADGSFWEPFPWGEPEMAFLNETVFSNVDTLALSRPLYEAIVPWWDAVARNEQPADAPPPGRTLSGDHTRTVVAGDITGRLAALKRSQGGDVWLGCGPATLAPLAAASGLIDEFLLVLHPAVLANGPRLLDGLTVDLALGLLDSQVFEAGAVVLRYRTCNTTNSS